jgi:hypothetical protein
MRLRAAAAPDEASRVDDYLIGLNFSGWVRFGRPVLGGSVGLEANTTSSWFRASPQGTPAWVPC